MPKLIADNITIPREVQNDCDPGDRTYIKNATALQSESILFQVESCIDTDDDIADTASYIGDICSTKNCSAFVSVGDNFYDSGVDFTSGGIIRFQEAWVDMYQEGVFEKAPWYQCLGNHDIVKGQSGVDFQTKIAPLYDDRWYFGTEKKPYYTYDLTGSDWSATFAVVDSDCFINKYQKNTSVYQNPYTTECHTKTQEQVDFVSEAFAASKADWKFLQLHHGFMSSSTNYTELAPDHRQDEVGRVVIDVVEQHGGIVMNGHDHCLAHYFYQNTNFILSGAAGYPQAGDCNNGVALGPYVKWLGANEESAANGFVTMDITKESIQVEYYARNMKFEGGDLYPVPHDGKPSYSFTVKQHAK